MEDNYTRLIHALRIITLAVALYGASVQARTVTTPVETNVAVSGNCNQTVTNSSGGTNILICTVNNSIIEEANRFYLVLGFSAVAPTINGPINWAFVDKHNSNIEISVDGNSVIDESLEKAFQDETLKVDRGQHIFTIETNLVYYPFQGQQAPPANAKCTSTLDVQAPGKIIPQLLIAQYPDGSIAPIRCGFTM